MPRSTSASSVTTSSSMVSTSSTTLGTTSATSPATTPATTLTASPTYAIESFSYTKVNNGEPTNLVCMVTGSPPLPSADISVTNTLGGNDGIILLETNASASSRSSWYQVIVRLDEVAQSFSCLVNSSDGNRVSKELTVTVYEPPRLNEAPIISQQATSHSIILRWSPWDEIRDYGDGPVIGYRVYYSTHGENIPKRASNDLITYTTFLISNLTRDTEYYVKVTAVRTGLMGEGTYSPVASGSTSCSAPSEAPVLSVRSRGQTSITLGWELITEDSWGCSTLSGIYIIVNSTDGQEGFPETYSANATASSVIIGNLQDCSTYTINAAFRNKDELGISSDTLPVFMSVILNSAGAYAVGVLPSLKVWWSVPSQCTVDSYYRLLYQLISRKACPDVPVRDAPNYELNTTSSSTYVSKQLSNLEYYATYTISIIAVIRGVESLPTIVSGYTFSGDPTGPPTNIGTTAIKKRSIVFTWEQPECGYRNGPITNYEVMLYDSKGVVVHLSNVSVSTRPPYEIFGLIPYSNYSISIRAWNYELAGEYGTEVWVQTDEAKPAPPEEVILPSSDQESITIEWMSPNPPLGRVIGYYILYWETDDADATPSNVSIPCVDGHCSDINYRFSGRIPNLKSDTNYSVQVQAESMRGIGLPNPDPPGVRITSEGIPSDPQEVSITSSTKSSLTITWTQPKYPRGNITSYTLAYKVKGKPYDSSFQMGDLFTFQDVDGDRTSFVLDNLVPATHYEIYVVASTSKGMGDSSLHVFEFTAPPAAEDLPKPSAPAILLSPDGLPTIQFSDLLESQFITHMLVAVEERLPVARRRRQQAQYGSYSENPSSYIAASISKDDIPIELTLGDNKTYGDYYNAPLKDKAIYSIRTGVESNVGGQSSTLYGDSTELRTVLPVIEGEPVILSTTSTTVRLQWNAWSEGNDIGNPPLVGYDVFVRTYGDWIVDQRVDQPTTSATVEGLNPDTEYRFSVAVVREGTGGTGPRSPEDRTRTLCGKPSGSPTGVQVSAINQRELELTWQSISPESAECRSGVTHYVIYYTPIGSTSPNLVSVYGATSDILTGLDTFLDYTIQITASNKDEESDRSSEAVGKTLEEVSPPPINVKIPRTTRSSLTVTWSAPLPSNINGNIQKYIIRYQQTNPDVNGGYNTVEVLSGAFDEEHTISYLPPETNYIVQVQTVNGAGSSEWSIPVNATTILSGGNDGTKIPVGAVIGGLMALLMIILLPIVAVVFYRRIKQRRTSAPNTTSEATPPYENPAFDQSKIELHTYKALDADDAHIYQTIAADPHTNLDPTQDTRTYLDPTPDTHTYKDPTPDTHTYIDPTPDTHTYLDPTPDTHTYANSNVIHNRPTTLRRSTVE